MGSGLSNLPQQQQQIPCSNNNVTNTYTDDEGYPEWDARPKQHFRSQRVTLLCKALDSEKRVACLFIPNFGNIFTLVFRSRGWWEPGANGGGRRLCRRRWSQKSKVEDFF